MKMEKEKDYPNKASWSRGRRIDFRFNSLWASQVAQLVKNLPANAGDTRDVGSIPGSGRSSGEGNGNPLQYFCLGNPMDRRAWQGYSPCGHRELDMTECTSNSNIDDLQCCVTFRCTVK